MPSIIEGYNYDIFISYRLKDNKGNKWISKFVASLKTELESTFKEDISVYFDINPHDGLLETHDVDASLKDKLKCLVFIPIISRTYCDPKSFAWEHEFKAFVEQASQDQFGLKVKLPNGNVVNRVLPVRIHDLEIADIKECESVLGGVIRGIEFVYKEAGVNRPLTHKDIEKNNFNKITYRNQLNKVALATKEIITAIQKSNRIECQKLKIDLKTKPKFFKPTKSRLMLAGIGALLIIGLTFFNNILGLLNIKNKSVRNESVISIIYENNTTDSSRKIDPEIIEFLVKLNLSNKCNMILLDNNQFNIIYPQSKKSLPLKNIEIRIISGELIHQYDIEYKIIDNQNRSVIKNKTTFYNKSDLLNFGGNLSKIISDLGTNISKKNFLTDDWKSFEAYYKGEKEWAALNKIEAKKCFLKSIEIDTTFTLPYLRLSEVFHYEENNKIAKEFIDTVLRLGNLTKPDSIKAEALSYKINGDRRKAIACYESLFQYLPADKEPNYELGEAYFRNGDIQDASLNYRSALTIDPEYSLAHNHLAYCYSALGQHDVALVHAGKYLALDSTANAWDTYGDIFIAKGDLASARWAKNQCLKLDSLRDYFYQGLANINVQEMKFREAEKNIDRYISLATDPVRLSRGLTNKAFIYFAKQEYEKALDTCLKAKSIFDSKELLTRNHVLHWILARIYLEINDGDSFASEMQDMEEIISKNKITPVNYNMIFKFKKDAEIHELFKNRKIKEAAAIIEIFDDDINIKVNEWNYPFNVTYFNTEFGKLYMEIDSLDSAKKRFEKALEYNKNYPFAHLGLAGYYFFKGNNTEFYTHRSVFNKITRDADSDALKMVDSQFDKLVKKPD